MTNLKIKKPIIVAEIKGLSDELKDFLNDYLRVGDSKALNVVSIERLVDIIICCGCFDDKVAKEIVELKNFMEERKLYNIIY